MCFVKVIGLLTLQRLSLNHLLRTWTYYGFRQTVSSLNFFAVSVSLAHLLFDLTSLSIPGIVMLAASLFFLSSKTRQQSILFRQSLFAVDFDFRLSLEIGWFFFFTKNASNLKGRTCLHLCSSLSTRIDCLFDIAEEKNVSLNNSKTHRREAENRFNLKNHWQWNKSKGSKSYQGKKLSINKRISDAKFIAFTRMIKMEKIFFQSGVLYICL